MLRNVIGSLDFSQKTAREPTSCVDVYGKARREKLTTLLSYPHEVGLVLLPSTQNSRRKSKTRNRTLVHFSTSPTLHILFPFRINMTHRTGGPCCPASSYAVRQVLNLLSIHCPVCDHAREENDQLPVFHSISPRDNVFVSTLEGKEEKKRGAPMRRYRLAGHAALNNPSLRIETLTNRASSADRNRCSVCVCVWLCVCAQGPFLFPE